MTPTPKARVIKPRTVRARRMYSNGNQTLACYKKGQLCKHPGIWIPADPASREAMVERMARAIHEEDFDRLKNGPKVNWSDAGDGYREIQRQRARAALAAIRK